MTRLRMLRRRRVWNGLLVATTATVTLLATAAVAVAQPVDPRPAPVPKQVPAVRGVKPVKPVFPKATPQPQSYVPARTHWPAAAAATIRLDTPKVGAARATVPSTPVWAEPVGSDAGPGFVQVRIRDHAAATAAGIAGVLFTVAGDKTGNARVGVTYRDFAEAYGGNFGARLRLSSYPPCVLTTPEAPRCQVATPLTSTNDTDAMAVSAKVRVPTGTAMVIAAEGDDSGPTGTYSATTLKPSGSWTGGDSSGSFNYSYPLTLAQSPSSLVPKLALSYDSSATDGQTSATQSQASWVGEGWDAPSSYIEQSFESCSESPGGKPAPTKIYDQCYTGPILTMALNGSTTSLVWDATRKVFRTKHADGAVIKHYCTKLTDPTCVIGTSNGSESYAKDWFEVIERDGTTYAFGRNRLPGWNSTEKTTNSVATQPVYSPHAGDPCYSSSGFSSSVCTMAYRWGLDYVTDVHGNASAYYYKQDTNFYGQYKGDSDVSYVRDQYLARIDYGFTDGNAYDTVPNQIVFQTAERCVTGTCTPLSATTAKNWPDVPFDLVCASGADCKSQAPSYFSTIRLTGIVVQQYATATAKYTPVDSYAFTQTTPATGDGTAATLWLSNIVHTGAALDGGGSGDPITEPPVSFASTVRPNRVDSASDGQPAYYKHRLEKITTETGSQIDVTYGLVDACTAPVTKTAAGNTSSCYPVSRTPDGYTAPITDWFNKYVVTKVVQTDPTGGATAQATAYEYQGGAAWHYDDNELVKAKHRTYGQFRGYGSVLTYVGDGVNDPRAKTRTDYYRGMSRNNNTTVVNVTDSQGGLHEDTDQLAGRVLETTAYLGSTVDNSTITSYWVSGDAATRSRTGLPALTSNWVAPVETFTRQALTSTGTTTWRYTQTDTSYVSSLTDPYVGLEQHKFTHTTPIDAKFSTCTTTKYAPVNTAKNLVGLVAETESVSVACGGYTAGAKPSAPSTMNTLTAPGTVARPDQVISASRTFYDDEAFATTFPQPAAPTTGDVTMVRQAADHAGGNYTWQTLSRSRFDAIGRPTDVYEGEGNNTHTTYAANSVGLTTKQTVTNALGHQMSSTLEPQRGATLTTTDPNGVVTTQRYDALGRLTSVWLASRATTLPANFVFSYLVSNTGISATTTKKLNNSSGYQTSTLIYDALLRPRQNQAMTPQGGRLISDTFYDSRGWVAAKYTNWWDSAATPNTALVSAADLHAQVPRANAYTYNSLGAVVTDRNLKNGLEVSKNTTVNNGDRTTTIPATGGTVSTVVSDPLGRTTEARSYQVRPTLNSPADPFTGIFTITGGSGDVLSYGYDGHGNQSSVTQGPAGSGGPVWTDTYNLLGRIVAKSDPDAGVTKDMKYDGVGNLTQVTDAREKTVSYAYDDLSRKTGVFRSAVSAQVPGAAGNQLAAWVYDNSNGVAGITRAIGKLTTATSYVDGAEYTTQQLNYNVFGQSAGSTTTIPVTEGALAGSYTVRHLYSTTTGLPSRDLYTAQGGLPAETVNHTYQGVFDLPDTLNGMAGYYQGTTYDAYGRVEQQKLGSGTNLAYVTNTYDLNNGLLKRQLVTRSGGAPAAVDDQNYEHDLAGNITVRKNTRLGSADSSETQCFSYDGLTQLVGAWTANDNCAAAPTQANSSMVADKLGPASAYWTSWTFDNRTNRATQVQHAFADGPTADTVTTYGYGNGSGQPHTLTSTSTTGATAAATSYAYDAAGNMTTRNAGQGNQTLTYNDANQLTGITGSTAGTTTFRYDADGQLLAQKDPGTTTIYIDNQQFTLNTATGVVTGARYYDLPGGGQVVRTGTTATQFTYKLGDNNGTPALYLDNTAQVPAWRQFTPYGGTRGTAVAGPDNRGFLNKPASAATGLTVLGARQYDPSTGRFLTADPVLQRTDPTQLNGYGYAGNSPITLSDPTGLMVPPDQRVPGRQLNGAPAVHTGPTNDEGTKGGRTTKGGTGNGNGNGRVNSGNSGFSGSGNDPEFTPVNRTPVRGPMPGMSASQLQKMGTEGYYTVMQGVAGKSKFFDYMQSTVLLAEVNVEIKMKDGSVRTVPRMIAFTNAGDLSQHLEKELQRNGVQIIRANPGAGSNGKGHAEGAAAAFRRNVAAQRTLLGGPMSGVLESITTNGACSQQCANDHSKFIGNGTKLQKGDHGYSTARGSALTKGFIQKLGGAGRPFEKLGQFGPGYLKPMDVTDGVDDDNPMG